MIYTACLLWTLLFSDGRNTTTRIDPGSTYAKPAGLDSYICGGVEQVVYVFYLGEPWAVMGYWTALEIDFNSETPP